MRIHFTRRDLALTSLADGPDPLWELVNSLQALQGGYARVVLGQWRQRAAHDLRQAGLAGPTWARLVPVAPHASYFPDLLTPPEAALGFDEGVAAVLTTPRRQLSAEIGRLSGGPGAGEWLADLAAGRAGALTDLDETLRAYHRFAVAPYWDRLRGEVRHDVAQRRRILLERGIDGLLSSFEPQIRWQSPVLELARHPSDRDVHLGGRGLRLVPSFFCQLHPLTIFDNELPQVVVYPVEHDPRWLTGPLEPDGSILSRLLGETRAAVLLASLEECTTTELARRANVSLASASRHAAVLREAGLVDTRRDGGSVRHAATALGAALVAGRPR